MNDNLAERWAELPLNLANHLKLALVAIAVGVIISVPLAILATRKHKLRYPLLTAAAVIQTIPSLALLALMVPLIVYTGGFGIGISAFGFYPAVIALTLYSILPILRNTVTGIMGVDEDLVDAARGVGMSDRQVLTWVQLPLAAPVIMAGIRTATVWVVGMATLATPVGQRSLGNYIFTGLQTRNWVMVTFGVVASAVLALVLDSLLGGLERAASTRRRKLGVACGAALAFVVVVGLASPSFISASGEAPVAAEAQGPSAEQKIGVVTLGAKTFTEQYILVELVSVALAEKGIQSKVTDSLGSTVIFDALKNGDVDMYIDYTGTLWANYMKRSDSPPSWRVDAELDAWLAREHNIRNMGSLGFENAYVFAMRAPDAAKLPELSMNALAKSGPSLVAGADYEFFGRPEWQAIRAGYGLGFKEKRSMDATLMYEALVAGDVDVIAAFSSDGRIAAYNLAILKDPREVVPPYDAVLLVGPRLADNRAVAAALAPLIGAISLDNMQRANLIVDRDDDKSTPSGAAQWLRGQIDSGSQAPSPR